jgi:hypothetical protein
MQKKHLIKKINDSPPTWSTELSGVELMDTNNSDWQDEKVESFYRDMPEEQLKSLSLSIIFNVFNCSYSVFSICDGISLWL